MAPTAIIMCVNGVCEARRRGATRAHGLRKGRCIKCCHKSCVGGAQCRELKAEGIDNAAAA